MSNGETDARVTDPPHLRSWIGNGREGIEKSLEGAGRQEVGGQEEAGKRNFSYWKRIR